MSDRGEAILEGNFCGKVLNFCAAILVLCKSLSVASSKQLVLEGNQSLTTWSVLKQFGFVVIMKI